MFDHTAMATEYTIRHAQLEDVAFLWHMLYEAAYWRSDLNKPSTADMLADDRLVRYVGGWGRFGDVGIIAEHRGGQPLGAAWFRLFPEERPGYGFIDEFTPELTVAVAKEYRGRGIGTIPLGNLLQKASAYGFPDLSLSVSTDNPALNLYKRLGFVQVKVSGESWTMRTHIKNSN